MPLYTFTLRYSPPSKLGFRLWFLIRNGELLHRTLEWFYPGRQILTARLRKILRTWPGRGSNPGMEVRHSKAGLYIKPVQMLLYTCSLWQVRAKLGRLFLPNCHLDWDLCWNKTLTHISLASHFRDIDEQCRPRSDAAECGVWLQSSLFANKNIYSK